MSTNIPCPCDSFKNCSNNEQRKQLCAHCRLTLKHEIVAKLGKRVYIDEDNAYRKPKNL